MLIEAHCLLHIIAQAHLIPDIDSTHMGGSVLEVLEIQVRIPPPHSRPSLLLPLRVFIARDSLRLRHRLKFTHQTFIYVVPLPVVRGTLAPLTSPLFLFKSLALTRHGSFCRRASAQEKSEAPCGSMQLYQTRNFCNIKKRLRSKGEIR
eukprot:g64811.t1